MLQEAYIATIWTETGINPDCWYKKIETDTCIVFVRDGGGVASPIKSLLSTFSLNEYKKGEENEEIAYHEHP